MFSPPPLTVFVPLQVYWRKHWQLPHPFTNTSVLSRASSLSLFSAFSRFMFLRFSFCVGNWVQDFSTQGRFKYNIIANHCPRGGPFFSHVFYAFPPLGKVNCIFYSPFMYWQVGFAPPSTSCGLNDFHFSNLHGPFLLPPV